MYPAKDIVNNCAVCRSSSKMDPEDFKDIENVPFISMFPEANVRSAMQYEPQANDVIIVTYPKCGTTWVQYIVTHILTKEEPPRNPAEFMLPAERVRALAELPPEKSMKSLKFFRDMCVDKNETHEGAAFVRKGNVGDWRSHYTAEHIASTKAWIAEKTKGCDVMDLWKDLELP
ncbi:hypothetical protein HPB50_015804 [Hyalomma asiaticum]|uniref:Uncharacterized protein n=1 Tax=Hyalomma asiaticum TaxID=266040 RepID=A0ACB7RTD6_HYAAI|nr:hypothetical protein HPB50_015804 [Hyalomma asiaticum]